MLFSARRFIRRCLDGSIFKKGNHVVAELGAAIGIPGLQLEQDSCTLSVDGTLVTLELDPAHNRLLVSSYLAEAEGLLKPGTGRALLEATLDGVIDATGMVFAVDKAEGRIVMVTALFLDDLSGEDLAAALSRFVARAQTWRARLDEPARSADAAAPRFMAPALFA
ncbi:type III secretion system chaperone [Hydrogenophaga sp. T2]|uniref:type III secretion system chaperone n=1 Tax=Hydrogenophaga sp. T2 TaxID=3132823 RepID=UPI003CECAB01